MGLIEKMISDAVRRETGFNPRRLIRRVGGRNILLAGGAALAGGLLASQLSGQQQSASGAMPSSPTLDPQRPSPPPANLPPPSLPPLPVTKAAEAPTLPPPPTLPDPSDVSANEEAEAEGAAEEQSTEGLPKEVRFAITRTMVAAALADGELAAGEKALIDEQLGSGEFDENEVAQIRKDLVVPPSASELANAMPSSESGGGELLLQFALLAARADGVLSPRERTWLQGLGRKVGIEATRIEAIEKELFSAASPS